MFHHVPQLASLIAGPRVQLLRQKLKINNGNNYYFIIPVILIL